MTDTHKASGFAALGVADKLVQSLHKHNITQPTPIQAAAIGPALTGGDILGIAQTGTGKTLAFSLPMLQRLAREFPKDGQALVVLPTRELALQVEETLHLIGRDAKIITVAMIGGASMFKQVQQLRRQPHVMVATPGRLIDHMRQNPKLLKNIKIAVLDEADRMFDIGFAPHIKQIMGALPSDRQTMLFSATMPKEILDLAHKYLKNPKRIEVAPQGTTNKTIEHHQLQTQMGKKLPDLQRVLNQEKGTVLVFSRTKHGAKKIARAIREAGHTATELHANKSLAQRKAALAGFKSGQYRVMVATDIAARGIDVNDIGLVVNYDLPTTVEDYVHRTGRTGRAGKSGRAVSFVTPDERHTVRKIEDRLKLRLSPLSA